MALRYVIRHPDKGLFVGFRRGQRQPLWTGTYAGGADRVPTMTRVAGQTFVRTIREPRAKLVVCEPDCAGFASVHACMRAGIPGWIPDLPGANAPDTIWDWFVEEALKTCGDGPVGRMDNHRFGDETS